MSYACLKSVNYALFFWIPFYLTVSLHMGNSQAGTFSVRAVICRAHSEDKTLKRLTSCINCLDAV
jgi:hypothetical protein